MDGSFEIELVAMTHFTDLELSNIESIPNSAAEDPASSGFILAFVCTMGASSNPGLCELA